MKRIFLLTICFVLLVSACSFAESQPTQGSVLIGDTGEAFDLDQLSRYLGTPCYRGTSPANAQTVILLAGGSAAEMQSIRNYCTLHDTPLLVLAAPSYPNQVDEAALKTWAGLCGYWCFYDSAIVNRDSRYFNEDGSVSADTARMMLARIFHDDSVYVPEDFGYFVTAETIEADLQTATAPKVQVPYASYTVNVPVLMYHELMETPEEALQAQSVSAERFQEQMEALYAAGFHAISPADMDNYVTKGTPLPEKPFLITFDDGYRSSLEYSAPVLEACGFQATIFCIGVSVGKDTYKDTGIAITPHFSFEEVQEWCEKGIIHIGSHTYDLHLNERLDGPGSRFGLVQFEGEADEDYMALILADFTQSMQQLSAAFPNQPIIAFSYPQGKVNLLAEHALRQVGFRITFSTQIGTNQLVKGLPSSLSLLRRNLVQETWTGDVIVNYMNGLL